MFVCNSLCVICLCAICMTQFVCNTIGTVLLCLCAICMTQAQGGSLLVGRLGREVSVSGKGGTRAAQFNPSFLPPTFSLRSPISPSSSSLHCCHLSHTSRCPLRGWLTIMQIAAEVIHADSGRSLNWSNCSQHNCQRPLWKEAEIDRNLNWQPILV